MVQESEFISALREEILNMETRLQELQVQAKLGEMELRDRLKPKIDELEKDLKTAQEEFQRLNDVSADAFDSAKQGLENAVGELQKGFEQTMDILLGNKNK